MKRTLFALVALTSILLAHPLFAEGDAQAEFYKQVAGKAKINRTKGLCPFHASQLR